ncbi:uncharacterized protein [Littorina saxatilis]|uniref:uncharacterized protein n=1 Tax=Littorina saxatilis TaxID=31220 RepID=UPI0038B59439
MDLPLSIHTLESVDAIKYLGVTIQKDAGWDKHINNVCAKANSALGMLRRNLKIGSPKTKELAYKSLVRPIVEYACTVWDPHKIKEVSQIEKVQRRAARFVLNRHKQTASVDDMLNELEWPSLEERRKEARLSMLKKITSGSAHVRCEELHLLAPRARRGVPTERQQFKRIPARTNYRKNSFLPRTIRDWNETPSSLLLSHPQAPDSCTAQESSSCIVQELPSPQ